MANCRIKKSIIVANLDVYRKEGWRLVVSLPDRPLITTLGNWFDLKLLTNRYLLISSGRNNQIAEPFGIRKF
jgi:hypothetical protein